MKTFAWHVLILGGFYFIVSLLSSFPQGAGADVASITILSIFFIMFIVLCFKKKYDFISRFQNKFAKTSNYLAALGFCEYFSIIFMLIPGMIYEHKAAKAQYNGAEIPPAPIAYLTYVYYIYIVFLCLSVIWATYKSFRKKIVSKQEI